MISPKRHLQALHMDRDDAFRKTMASLEEAKQQLKFKGLDLESFARKNPEAAVAGAMVLGVAASSLFLNRNTMTKLTKAVGIVVLGPLVGDLTEWLLQLFSLGSVPPAKKS